MDHPECFERLRARRMRGLDREATCVGNSPAWRQEDWMSSEDTEARADAIRFADGHVPMALESSGDDPPPRPKNPEPLLGTHAEGPLTIEETWGPDPEVKPKRKRRTPEEIAADKLEREQAREAAKAERARAREEAKALRAVQRIEAKEQAKRDKIAAAERGRVELPALVTRDGTVTAITEQDAWAVIGLYLDWLFVDCENSGYPIGHELYELRTVQLGGAEMAVIMDAREPAQMQVVSLALSLAKRLSAHSAAADVVPLVHAGAIGWDEIWAKMHDSVLYLKLIDPKLSGSDASKLKEVAQDMLQFRAVSPQAEKDKNELFKAMGCLLETDNTTPPEKSGWYSVSPNAVVMCIYAGSDVLDLALLMRELPPLPVAESVLERERYLQAKCARIHLDGFDLDHGHIVKLIENRESAQKAARANVEILSDGKITNPSSPETVKALKELFPAMDFTVKDKKTRQIKDSAGKEVLERVSRVARKTENALLEHLCRQILDYRHNTTELGLLLRPLENLCSHGDGRMRPTVYTINADTGRTSCVRPNGQQFSRQGGIRQCVRAYPGYLGVDADFQGCEIRVAAGLSGDRDLLAAEIRPFCYKCDREASFTDPCSCGIGEEDGKLKLKAHSGLHWMAAHMAFGKAATKEHRYWCKRGIFCKLFGGGPETAASQVYCDLEPMQKVFAAFEELAPVYTSWDLWLRQCFKEGMLVWRDYETGENFSQKIEGSRRGIYRAYSGRQIYVDAPHKFGNYAIQGTARELLVDGIIRWAQGPWGHLPLLPVHDEILLWVPQAQAHEAVDYLVRCMETRVLSTPDWEVMIGADPSELFSSWPDSSLCVTRAHSRVSFTHDYLQPFPQAHKR